MKGVRSSQQIAEACGRRLNLSVTVLARSQHVTMAGHDVLVIEAAPGSAEPFAFAAAAKQRNPQTVVALLLHAPTRERVIQALHTRADTTVGWPSTDEQLATKIETILNSLKAQPS